ncbi:hypothetical protein D3C78_982560 [compost metagenome]
MEQAGDQRFGEDRQGQRRRHADQQHHAQRPVDGRREGLGVAAGMLARQAGQDHRADGDAEGAQRQLRQAVGVVQPGHAAGLQEGGQHGIQQQVDLADRHAEQRRQHQGHDPLHALVLAVRARNRQQLYAHEERQLEQQLGQACDEHAPGQRHDRLVEVRGEQHRRADHADIQQHRGEGRHGEAPVAVEDAAAEGGQRDQQQVGEGDAQQLAGQGELFRLAAKARREQHDQIGRGHHAEGGDGGQRQPEGAGDPVDQLLDLGQAALRAVLGEHRHEGLGEGALGEQAAHEVGNLEGDEECIGRRTGAEIGRHHHVADHAEHPREQGHHTDNGTGTQQTAFGRLTGHALIPTLQRSASLS